MCSRSHQLKIAAALTLALAMLASPLQAENLDDPMRPPQASTFNKTRTKTSDGYHLSSIMISSEQRRAIINGKSVGIGDTIGKARVEEIQGYEVKLSIAGKTRILSLLPVSIKKPAEASSQ